MDKQRGVTRVGVGEATSDKGVAMAGEGGNEWE